jgi:hypothetical protein
VNVSGSDSVARYLTVTDCSSIGVRFFGENSLLTNSNFVRVLEGVDIIGANNIVDSITITNCELGAQISGQGSYFTNSEVNGCIDGVVIQSADGVTVAGNLIHNLYASPSINGSQIIFPNVIGILVANSSFYELNQNQILNLSTSIDQRGGGEGGVVAGIYIDAGSDGTVKSCSIGGVTGKSSAYFLPGGDAQGVYISDSFNVVLLSNLIQGVRGGDNAEQHVGGSAYGIYAMNASAIIQRNQVCLFPSSLFFLFVYQLQES